MNRKLLQLYLLGFVLISDFKLFAQDPPPSDDGDNPDYPVEGDDDPTAAPINGKLIWLALVGILFAMYIYRSNRKVRA
jgi:hypothetical protein